MKKVALLALSLAFALCTLAQTKHIAYRSHSGSNAVFALLEDDNLGDPPLDFDKEWEEGIIIQDSLEKRRSDSLRFLFVKDSINKVRVKDSLQKNKAKKLPNNLKDTSALIKKNETIDKVTPVEQKKQSFPLYLFLLIAIPTAITAFITKKHIK